MLCAFLLFILVLIKQSIPQFYAKWRLKYRLFISSCSYVYFQQLRFWPTVAVESNVPVTLQDFRTRASSDNQLSTSRRRSYCCQELDLESQKGQPHVQAILQNHDHDWNTIADALAYLHKHSTFLWNIYKCIWDMYIKSEIQKNILSSCPDIKITTYSCNLDENVLVIVFRCLYVKIFIVRNFNEIISPRL